VHSNATIEDNPSFFVWDVFGCFNPVLIFTVSINCCFDTGSLCKGYISQHH
jgi:hypothetical protein